MSRPGTRPQAVDLGTQVAATTTAAAARPAPRVVTLVAADYADTWPHRPIDPVRVGIRLVGQETISNAERQSLDSTIVRFQRDDVPEELADVRRDMAIEHYNSSLRVNILAHALCKPDDTHQHFFPKAPHAVIPQAFHPATIEMLWEEFSVLRETLSPLVRLATDDELAALMPHPERATNRMRRLVALMHDELAALYAEE